LQGGDALSHISISVATPRDVYPPPNCPFNDCRASRLEQVEQAKLEWEFTADSIPQLIFLLDRDDRILRVNRTLENWGLGLVVDARGRRLHDLLHPHCHDPDCHLANIWRSSVDHMEQDFAVEYQSEDKFLGRYLNLHFRFHRSQQDTEAGFVVAVISDISDLKHTEKMLQNSNIELERRIEESTFALVSTNIRLQQEIEEHKRIEEKLESSREEYRQLVEAMNEGLAILDKQGESIGSFTILIDDGEQLNVKQVLNESAKEIEELYDNAPCGYHTLDSNGVFIKVNNTKAKWLGYAKAEMIGNMRFVDILTPASAELYEQNLPQLGSTGDLRDLEVELVCKDGSILPVLLCASAVHDAKGQLTMSRATVYDISYRKNAEQALRESEHTKRLLAAQVMSAQEKERKRIASELHDGIGQTLSAIKFYVENAIRSLNENTIENSAQMFRNIIPKLQSAIEEVRRISMDLRPSLLDDIGTLATLSWFCREFQAIYESIRIELRLDIKETDIPAPLKVAIFRIVQEAMNNCAKYGQASCIHISLTNTGKEIELAVEDDGQGFDRIEVNARINGASGGMGLVSMRERAEYSGGTFTLESAKGRGTSMHVVWPLQKLQIPSVTG
jgi:PAS domain S-box-containing protein